MIFKRQKSEYVWSLINKLHNKNEVFFNFQNKIVSLNERSNKNIDFELLKSLDIVINLSDKIIYHTVGSYPISIAFLLKNKNDVFYIINVKKGKEDFINSYFYLNNKDTKKIVVLEEINQSKYLKIENIYYFATIKDRIVSFYRNT